MIYSMGEMLIDFMQEGTVFVPYPGGAPANLAIHAKRAGAKAQFVGKLSSDSFGKLLKSTLDQDGVCYPLDTCDKPTALALVTHDDGERSFQFYRKETADLYLSREDIDRIDFKKEDILHFCSLGLVSDASTYDAHRYAIRRIKEAGGIVSFDVNLRPGLWEDLELAKERVLECIQDSDLVKVNEEELEWLAPGTSVEQSLKQIQTKNQLIITTLGSEGSCALLSNGELLHKEIQKVEQIDTTGAGDSFSAMILVSLSHFPGNFEDWQTEELHNALDHASNVSAQVVAKAGAIPEVTY